MLKKAHYQIGSEFFSAMFRDIEKFTEPGFIKICIDN